MTAQSPGERTLGLLGLFARSPRFASLPLLGADRDSLIAFAELSGWIKPGRPQDDALRWSRPFGAAWVNTARANPDRDGAVWQGRGATAAASGGFTYERSVFRVAIRPLGFVTQNLEYEPSRIVDMPAGDFRDPYLGHSLDMPYRFGPGVYGRVEPGESWALIESKYVGGGFSTASQRWGPSHYYPLVLGVEAGGFPRIEARLNSIPVGVGTFSALWSVGRLESSTYFTDPPGSRSRVMPALVAAFRPRWLEGFEIGGARVFHVRWRAEDISLDTFTLPFRGLLKSSDATGESSGREYNQLASVFLRIAPPTLGAELYGELYREDHNWDLRDLIGEPDHASAYALGLRRAWAPAAGVLRSVTLEIVNGRISHMARLRGEAPIYIHGSAGLGHTSRGQTLGSVAALGGAALTVAFDQIGEVASTTWQAEVRNVAQDQEGGTYQGRLASVFSARVNRMFGRNRMVSGWGASLEQGTGFAKHLNVSARISVKVQNIESTAK